MASIAAAPLSVVRRWNTKCTAVIRLLLRRMCIGHPQLPHRLPWIQHQPNVVVVVLGDAGDVKGTVMSFRVGDVEASVGVGAGGSKIN